MMLLPEIHVHVHRHTMEGEKDNRIVLPFGQASLDSM